MIDIENMTFAYGGRPPIFQGFNWNIPKGEAWSVIGPSGCGKTTLLYLLAGLRRPSTGQIIIDASYRSSVPGIYAIGDLVPGPMLAHKASAEGIAAVECIAGKPGEVNYDALPAVIYTWPEVASVGLTEEQLKDRDIPYCVGTYPFTGAGRARCMGETEGFVKVIAHGKTDRILGIHIIGPRGADMIAECGLAVELGASSEDIARTVHGHPTFAEALQEAAMAVQKCSIYAS